MLLNLLDCSGSRRRGPLSRRTVMFRGQGDENADTATSKKRYMKEASGAEAF
jgi:hypothetical protein